MVTSEAIGGIDGFSKGLHPTPTTTVHVRATILQQLPKNCCYFKNRWNEQKIDKFHLWNHHRQSRNLFANNIVATIQNKTVGKLVTHQKSLNPLTGRGANWLHFAIQV